MNNFSDFTLKYILDVGILNFIMTFTLSDIFTIILCAGLSMAFALLIILLWGVIRSLGD